MHNCSLRFHFLDFLWSCRQVGHGGARDTGRMSAARIVDDLVVARDADAAADADAVVATANTAHAVMPLAAAAGELPHRRHSCSRTPLLLLSNLTDLWALTNQQLHAGDFKDFELFASQEDCVNFVYQKKHLANLAAYAINLYPAHQLKTLL